MISPSEPRFPYSIVDLTHPLAPGMPLWPGDPATERSAWANHEQQGWLLHRWTLGEHSGTHLGAPAHFLPRGGTVDALPVETLVLPAVVFDTHEAGTGSAAIGVDHLLEWESGSANSIPRGAAMLLRTGWNRRWPDPARVFERDPAGQFTWPGFSPETVRWLIEERGTRAIGSDAPGIDAGSDSSFSAGIACAEGGAVHLENLAGLDQLPPLGAWLVLGVLPLAGGSGAPARILALVDRMD